MNETIISECHLYYQQGSSDKEYHIELIKYDSMYCVHYK